MTLAERLAQADLVMTRYSGFSERSVEIPLPDVLRKLFLAGFNFEPIQGLAYTYRVVGYGSAFYASQGRSCKSRTYLQLETGTWDADLSPVQESAH